MKTIKSMSRIVVGAVSLVMIASPGLTQSGSFSDFQPPAQQPVQSVEGSFKQNIQPNKLAPSVQQPGLSLPTQQPVQIPVTPSFGLESQKALQPVVGIQPAVQQPVQSPVVQPLGLESQPVVGSQHNEVQPSTELPTELLSKIYLDRILKENPTLIDKQRFMEQQQPSELKHQNVLQPEAETLQPTYQSQEINRVELESKDVREQATRQLETAKVVKQVRQPRMLKEMTAQDLIKLDPCQSNSSQDLETGTSRLKVISSGCTEQLQELPSEKKSMKAADVSLMPHNKMTNQTYTGREILNAEPRVDQYRNPVNAPVKPSQHRNELNKQSYQPHEVWSTEPATKQRPVELETGDYSQKIQQSTTMMQPVKPAANPTTPRNEQAHQAQPDEVWNVQLQVGR